MGKDISCQWTDGKAGVAVLLLDKTDFKTKATKKDKEGHYLMVKGSIQKEDITIINIYANIRAPRYLQQILTDIKGEIDGNTIIVGDFNTPLTSMDRSSRQKINKATEILKDTIEKLDLIDIFSTFKKIIIRILLKYTWNILKNCTYWGTKLTSVNLRI